MPTKKIHLADLIVKYLNTLEYEDRLRPKSIVSYLSDLKITYAEILQCDFYGPAIDSTKAYGYKTYGLVPLCSQDELFEITHNYIKSMKSLEDSSKSRKIFSLRRFQTYLFQQNIINKNPFHNYQSRVRRKLPRHISVDEALLCLEKAAFEATEGVTQQRIYVLFLILYGCGLRIQEACNITWDAVSLGKGYIEVVGKGGKVRRMTMPPMLTKELARLSRTHSSIWGEKPLNPRTAYNYINRLGIKAQLSLKLHPHMLRHSYATHLLTSGADLRIIQELLGHKDLTSTEIYTHISIDKLSQTLEKCHPLSQFKKV